MDNLEVLVRKLKAHGSDADSAFQELYEATSRTALAVIRRYCDVKEDYEDLLQETYIRVYRSIDSLKDDTKALAWIRRIAGNTAIRHNMKQRPQMFSEMEDEDGNVPDFEDTSGVYDPSRVVDQKVVSQAIAQVLDSLPLDQRTALWRVYGQQMTIREVAAELGISENTIKSRLYQGRNKLLAKKDEFRRLGVELAAVPIAILIAVAFEDTVYAAPLAAGTAAGAAAAARAAKKARKAAGHEAGKAGKAASIAKSGHAAKGITALGKLSIGTKAAAVAVAATVAVGGAGAVVAITSSHSTHLDTEQPKVTAAAETAGETVVETRIVEEENTKKVPVIYEALPEIVSAKVSDGKIQVCDVILPLFDEMSKIMEPLEESQSGLKAEDYDPDRIQDAGTVSLISVYKDGTRYMTIEVHNCLESAQPMKNCIGDLFLDDEAKKESFFPGGLRADGKGLSVSDVFALYGEDQVTDAFRDENPVLFYQEEMKDIERGKITLVPGTKYVMRFFYDKDTSEITRIGYNMSEHWFYFVDE